jgi:hypothetical protein
MVAVVVLQLINKIKISMRNKFKFLILIFHFLLLQCSLEQGYVYSTKFFEPVGYKSPTPKKVCLLPLENKDPRITEYLAEQEFNSFPIYTKSDSEKEGIKYNKSLNESLLQYIRSKNIFQQIDFCDRQNQDFRLKLILEKYNISIYYPIHPMPAALFLMGIPLFIATVEYNISIRIEIFHNSEKISTYPHKEFLEFNILEREVPRGGYKYIEVLQTRIGSSHEIYLDGIYDKLFDKIYLDAKSWK